MKKKFSIGIPMPNGSYRLKLILCMKLIAGLLFLGMMNVSANTFSQSNLVTLELNQASLKDFFDQVQDQTDYLFFYQDKLIKANQGNKITLNIKDKPLDQVLVSILESRNLTYEISGRQIAVIPSKKAPVLTNPSTKKIDLQDRVVSGLVRDENGEPLPGVSILIRGTSKGTTTDLDGKFSIEVPENATLIFQYLGFKKEEIQVGNRSEITVSLKADVSDLSEFVVTGYGVQEKRAVTGSMSSVSGADIENLPVGSFDKALQGRAAGVLVQSSSGVPGGQVNINIRGQGSITAGNQPLYIVDGVQLNSESVNTNRTENNPLAFLNPNDIESMEILKDAAAASIYGAQAANGVVLITTKKGKAGKTRFNLNYYKGITEPMPKVQMMNSQQFINARIEAMSNRFPARTPETIRTGVLNDLRLPTDLTDEQIAGLPTYDWQDIAFRTGVVDNLDLTASGGNDKTTFIMSGSYNNHVGNVVAIDFQRATARLGVTHKANERLTFEMNTNLSSIVQNGNDGVGTTGLFAAPQFASPMIVPTEPFRLEDGSWNAPLGGLPGTMRYNPVQTAEYNTAKSRQRSVIGNFSLRYKILDNLEFKSFYGLDYRIISSEFYIDPRTEGGFGRQGFLQIETMQNTNFITNQTLNYNTQINDKNRLNILLGAEYRSDMREREGATAEGFPTHQFRRMSSASTPLTTFGTWTGFKRFGVFGQANFEHDKKLFASAILRYDGSSRFGADNKFGFFPAFSVGWDFSQESFLYDSKSVDQLKLRFGYGQTGNDQVGNFASRGLYGGAGNYAGNPGIQPGGIANVDLGWERNITYNLGLDYSFFERRLYGAIEVFHRTSKDLLLNQPLPWISGYGNISNNIGEVVNKGVEIEISSDIIRKKDFLWKSSFNITFLDNEVTRLFDDLEVLPGNQSVRVGYPLRTNFEASYAGVNSATGRPMWYDANGDITYNPLNPGDYQIFGSELSKYFGGWANTFTYKSLSLDVFFTYDMGREYYNNANVGWYRNGFGIRNALESVYLERWTEPGQITPHPRPFEGGAETNGASYIRSSSRFLEDASFIRLKQVTLGYDINPKLLNRLKLTNARIYAQAVNLLTWTAWTGYDPEFYLGADGFTSNQGIVPQTRNYTVGIQLGF
ncbi:TonB-dependent receptor [Belliella sp. R4-6]|uniref:TonB-dependent receptor n=1 Tax=Belliella alkalica TaxID=1730871 RepID=A0ABS9VFK6_9BACT|nr:TonB-dependent receptor [Belliella alkalica]MCH7415235.1 TonB-dependent receptor [Belliella alkalica]